MLSFLAGSFFLWLEVMYPKLSPVTIRHKELSFQLHYVINEFDNEYLHVTTFSQTGDELFWYLSGGEFSML